MSESVSDAYLRVIPRRADRPLRSTPHHLGSFIVLGCAVTLLSPSLNTFEARAHTNLSHIGFLVAAGSIGYLFGSIITGRLLQDTPAHRLLGGGLLIIAVALVGLTMVSGLAALFALEMLLGFGGSSVDVTGNTVVLWVHKGGPVMNALHLAFGVGGILAPIIVSRSLVWTGNLRLGYVVVATITAVVALVIMRRPSPPNPHEEGQRGYPKGLTRLIVLGTAFFVSYAWLELGFLSWIVIYGRERGLDPIRVAPLLGAAFLTAFSLGRLVAIPVSAKVPPEVMMLVDITVTMAGLLIMLIGGRSSTAMWTGTIIVGIGVASMFPSMLSMSEPAIPSTSAVTSTFLVGASVGSIFLPPIIGRLIDANGPQAMPAMVLAGAVVCGAIVFTFVREAAKRQSGVAVSTAT